MANMPKAKYAWQAGFTMAPCICERGKEVAPAHALCVADYQDRWNQRRAS